jgi:hypothetical protein
VTSRNTGRTESGSKVAVKRASPPYPRLLDSTESNGSIRSHHGIPVGNACWVRLEQEVRSHRDPEVDSLNPVELTIHNNAVIAAETRAELDRNHDDMPKQMAKEREKEDAGKK